MRFTDAEGAAIHVLAIKSADGGFALLAGVEGYKSEPTGTTSFTVHGNVEIGDTTEIFEEAADIVLGG